MRKPKVITLQVVAVLAYLALLFFLYRGMLGLDTDALLFLNVLAQIALIIMGVLLALGDAWPKRHPWIVLSAFALAGGVAMFATYRQSQISGRESAEAQRQVAEAQKQAAVATAKLSDSMDRLGTQTGEISRVQGLNTDLQKTLLGQSGQLIDSSKRIADLSKQAIDTTTGGKSFCLMVLSAQFNPKAMTPVFERQGKEPLYDVRARISDSRKFEEMLKRKGSGPLTMELIGSTEVNLDLGNISSASALIRYDTSIEIDADISRHDFVIWFDARNGYWYEDLQLRKVGNAWVQAVRVFRMEGSKKAQLILTRIPKNFPGKPEWRN